MRDRLQTLADAARREISVASEPTAVEALRVRYLGKKGELSGVLGGMGKLPPDERRALGEVANQVKAELEQLLAQAIERVESAALESELRGPRLDVTLPGRTVSPGSRHPVSRTMEDIVRTFQRLGFEVAHGPEIELDYFNFEALNLPKDHPARDMQDTFYVDEPSLGHAKKADSSVLLRTHTSSVQPRFMLNRKPPIRAIMPGRVYRRDSDITHTPMFHQVEGLLVDQDVSFAELKGTLDAFVRAFFGSDTRTRFRPSFFPFTEPSAEVDVWFPNKKGGAGWIEWGGCGMVNPNVLRAVGVDPEEYTGFAFGMGLERTLQFRNGLTDMRDMVEGDVRFTLPFGVQA